MGDLCTGLEIVLRLKLFQNLKELPKREIKMIVMVFLQYYILHPPKNKFKEIFSSIKQEAFDLYNLFY